MHVAKFKELSCTVDRDAEVESHVSKRRKVLVLSSFTSGDRLNHQLNRRQ